MLVHDILPSVLFIESIYSFCLTFFKKLQVTELILAVFLQIFNFLIILVFEHILLMTFSSFVFVFHQHDLPGAILFNQLRPAVFEFFHWLVHLDDDLHGGF